MSAKAPAATSAHVRSAAAAALLRGCQGLHYAKPKLLGEAQVLTEEYQKSDTYKKNVAASAKRMATFKDKQKTKGISKLL